VGVGYLGRFHALIYSRMPEVALVGVVDPNADRAHAVAAEARPGGLVRARDGSHPTAGMSGAPRPCSAPKSRGLDVRASMGLQ